MQACLKPIFFLILADKESPRFNIIMVFKKTVIFRDKKALSNFYDYSSLWQKYDLKTYYIQFILIFLKIRIMREKSKYKVIFIYF